MSSPNASTQPHTMPSHAPASATSIGDRAIASLRVVNAASSPVVFSIPGTEYQLHLACMRPLPRASEGKRVRGEIHARALRMHRSDTGGRFIEPVYGQPRIVQGTVVAMDPSRSRVLLDLTVPAWLTLHSGQDIGAFREGEMWNCYVESGASFTPQGG